MKIIYFTGLALLIAVAVGACGDPLTDALNKRWPPVSVDQQRNKAIETAAAVLNSISTANFATGTDLKTIERLAGPLLKPPRRDDSPDQGRSGDASARSGLRSHIRS